MELKEYIQIIKKNIKLFVGVCLFFLIIIPSFFLYQSQKQEAVLSFDITRAGTQKSQDYQYDDFYRLQADEKFADTVVEWLKSPSVVSEIWKNTYQKQDELSLGKLSKVFKANKLSSQVIQVNFSVKDKKEAQEISQSIFKTIRKNTESLNEKQSRENWFHIIMRGPIVRNFSPDWLIVLGVSLLTGIFIGFWIVLFKHYIKEDK